ncbi:MAG: c-type cytochrome [Anaerolineae bacterium]|nr:c-type cytochrome [Anaerolineae bacterium]
MRKIFFLLLFSLAACSAPAERDPATAPTPTIDLASDAGKGMMVFQANCATCHALAEDVVIVGPSLAHIATTAGNRVEGLAAEDYLRESIVNPNAYTVEGFAEGAMQQNFATQLTSDDVTHVIAFLMTLE